MSAVFKESVGKPTAVRLLRADPDLAQGVDPELREAAAQKLVAPMAAIAPGEWHPKATLPEGSRDVGVLMLEGLMIRDVAILQSTCAEVVGRGDVLHPWDDLRGGAPIQPEVHWHVLEPAKVAIIDERFVRAAGAYPEVIAALVLRAVARAQALAVSLAISCVKGLKVRVLMLLWHLADRWGRVGPQGVSVPLVLTHHMIGRLVGATRPSVSAALKELEVEGTISKRPEGAWLLHGEPPADLQRAVDRAGAR